MNKILKGTIIALSITTMLAGCGKARSVRGYYFDPLLSNDILPGVDNQQSVHNTLGSPTTFGAYDDKTWYYISTTLRYKAVLRPEREYRRILAVHFDDKGTVANVENLGLDLAWNIDPSSDKTRTRGKELNLLQQLFMNVGRFAGAGGQQQGPNGPGPNGS